MVNKETPPDPNIGKEYWEWAPDKPLENAARATPRTPVVPAVVPDDSPPPLPELPPDPPDPLGS